MAAVALSGGTGHGVLRRSGVGLVAGIARVRGLRRGAVSRQVRPGPLLPRPVLRGRVRDSSRGRYRVNRLAALIFTQATVSSPSAVQPNNALQRTRRQSLRSFLLAAELDIVRRPNESRATLSIGVLVGMPRDCGPRRIQGRYRGPALNARQHSISANPPRPSACFPPVNFVVTACRRARASRSSSVGLAGRHLPAALASRQPVDCQRRIAGLLVAHLGRGIATVLLEAPHRLAGRPRLESLSRGLHVSCPTGHRAFASCCAPAFRHATRASFAHEPRFSSSRSRRSAALWRVPMRGARCQRSVGAANNALQRTRYARR